MHVFKEGAVIKELATLPAHIAKRQWEALTDEEDDLEVCCWTLRVA